MKWLVGLLLFPMVMPAALGAQTALGSLLYADPVGRGIRLTVVDAGPDRMTLKPEEGVENQLRKLVLAMAGPDQLKPPEAVVMVEPVPAAWKVGGLAGGVRVRHGEVTYWRYLPGHVLPVRFLFERQVWTLQSAELPRRSWAR